LKPNNRDFSTILNYEEVINKIQIQVKKKHHELLEDLAENIFRIIFQYRIVRKVNLKIEKLDIIKNSESVGIDFSKSRI
jgi:dihydroneopterin aldolase